MRSPRRSFLAGVLALPGAVVKAAASRSLEQRLLAELENLEIADTHEHFFNEQDRVAQQVDFFALVQAAYTGSDLVSAGMPPESLRVLRNEEAPEMDRWRAFEP
jgi:hypothetical protein